MKNSFINSKEFFFKYKDKEFIEKVIKKDLDPKKSALLPKNNIPVKTLKHNAKI